MIFTTSICANYVPKARVLAQSVRKHHPDARFVLSLVEKSVDPQIASDPNFDLVLTPADLSIPAYKTFLFKYSLVEASTAVKGHLMLRLMDLFAAENKFIYLDPDTWVISPMVELEQELDHKQIVLTPHLTEPDQTVEAIMDNEICALRHGVFNLGFLGIKRGIESARFLNWWADRLYHFCYADYAAGLFTDQRWIDLAPCFFEVSVFRHPGYNVAPWNLGRRVLSKDSSGALKVNREGLRFFHFSGLDSGANIGMIQKYCSDQSNPIFKLREEYLAACEQNGQSILGKTPWSYGYFDDGEAIRPEHRYRVKQGSVFIGDDPYAKRFSPIPQRSLKERIKAVAKKSAFLKKSYHSVRRVFG